MGNINGLTLSKMFVALGETFEMVGISVLIGAVGGCVVGSILYITRKNGLNPNHGLYQVTNGFVNVVRSLPFLILVIMMIPMTRFLVGTGFGTRAASVPLSVIAVALYARMVEQSLLEVNQTTIEACISMGATLPQLMRYVVFVEARSSLILGLTSVIISLMSYSTVMGLVGGGGIGDFAILYGYQGNQMDLLFVALIILICVVQVIQMIGEAVAHRFNKKYIKEGTL